MTDHHDDLSAAQWEEARDLFDRALLLGEDDRMAFVDRSTQDPLVAAQARSWLQSWGPAQDFFDQVSTDLATLVMAPTFVEGDLLQDRFLIKRFIAQGGMGEVYEAQDLKVGRAVALKVISQEWVQSRQARARFVSEVGLARQVTHTNVCRIHELFEEGNRLFFSMELLEGVTLTELLREPDPKNARLIACQVAAGLQAAHELGIVHGDLKPGNVIVVSGPGRPVRAVITDFGLARVAAATSQKSPLATSASDLLAGAAAGTPGYMAPEVQAGGGSSIKSDFYSLGKLLEKLMPGSKWVGRFTAEHPASRPESLAAAIDDLSGIATRRRVLWGVAAATVGGAASVAYWVGKVPRMAFGGRRRVLWSMDAGQNPNIFALEQLISAGLRQSPVVSLVSGAKLLAALKQAKLPTQQPISRADLLQVAKLERAAVLLCGTLQDMGGVLGLTIKCHVPDSPKANFEIHEKVRDENQIVALATALVRRLRYEFGESDPSILRSSVPLEQMTSKVPEAVDAYFRALQQYENGDANSALVHLDQALKLDPDFVLARAHRALCVSITESPAASLPEYEKAMARRSQLPEREKWWIEALFYSTRFDYPRAASAYEKLVVLDPDDALFARQLGYVRAGEGRLSEAIEPLRKAVQLDPFGANNHSQLISTLAEADQPEECQKAFAQAAAYGFPPGMEEGVALSRMIDGRYAEAEEILTHLHQTGEAAQRMKLIGVYLMRGKFREAAAMVEAELATARANRKEVERQHFLLWAAWVRFLTDSPTWRAAAAELTDVDADPFALEVQKEIGVLAALNGETVVLQAVLEKARQVHKNWPSARTLGIVSLLKGSLAQLAGQSFSADFPIAVGLWPMPSTFLLDARMNRVCGNYDLAVTAAARVEAARGKIMRHYVPAMLQFARWEKARSLGSLGRGAEARATYKKILADWGTISEFSVVRRIKSDCANA